jgi:general secretion pathway protein C
MGFDAKLKRFFPLVVCALIGLVAFFQSAGLGQLVASAVIGEASAPAPGDKTPPPTGVLAQPTSKKTGEPILARNIFDSETGPLTGDAGFKGGDLPLPTTPTPSGPVADEDPPCGFGRVLLIAASEDPQWSFARIEDDGGGAHLRRIGDDIGGHTLQAVGWNRVWLADGGGRCQMKLGDKRATPTRKPSGDDGGRGTTKAGRRGRELSPEMAAKINKVSDTEFNIERSLVNEILENQAELMKTARIVPEKDGDKAGIRLFGIRPNSLLDHLGLKNGDRLESINGFDMSDPQKALEAYARLAQADKLKVQVNRKGAPMSIDFNIQ